MKPGIIIAGMATLALAVFAVAEAHARWWGGDVDQQLFGHLIITIEESGTGGVGGIGGVGGDGGTGGAGGAVRAVNTVTTTAAINGIAKGKPGRALVTAVLVFEALPPEPPLPPEPDPRCTDKYEGQFPFFSEITRFEWGETYDDGSLLAGFVFPPGQGFCSDGTLSVADLTGLITGGTGRFEGASGAWRIEASSLTANTATTGTITVDLN